MSNTHMVSHEGIVVNANGNANCVQVKIISLPACAGCQARKTCMAANMKEKIIDATPLEPLKPGDTVLVKMKEKLGWIALFYAFFLPLLILVGLLFTLPSLGFSETLAGLAALGSLAPYYVVIYVFRKKIEKVFVFTAEKIKEI
ncbi:MAG TPA: SoxR reducing system RseC family protein [Candidatus Kapabacteria bacterium]|nr:SoxR reducing system RseC family protein [Candidatus Kapabacteria bacterium]